MKMLHSSYSQALRKLWGTFTDKYKYMMDGQNIFPSEKLNMCHCRCLVVLAFRQWFRVDFLVRDKRWQGILRETWQWNLRSQLDKLKCASSIGHCAPTAPFLAQFLVRWTKRDAFYTYNFIHEKCWQIWLILYIWLHSSKTDEKLGLFLMKFTYPFRHFFIYESVCVKNIAPMS